MPHATSLLKHSPINADLVAYRQHTAHSYYDGLEHALHVLQSSVVRFAVEDFLYGRMVVVSRREALSNVQGPANLIVAAFSRRLASTTTREADSRCYCIIDVEQRASPFRPLVVSISAAE